MKDLQIEITEASLNDVVAISEVQKEVWLSTFPNKEFGITKEDVLSEDFFSEEKMEKRREIINDPNSNTKFWVAKYKDKVIGYACARKLDGYNKIRSIYILSDFQGQGIGHQLMKIMFAWFDMKKPVKLTVAIYSLKAIAFYEKLGFVRGKRLAKNPDGSFVSGREGPEMEMIKMPLI